MQRILTNDYERVTLALHGHPVPQTTPNTVAADSAATSRPEGDLGSAGISVIRDHNCPEEPRLSTHPPSKEGTHVAKKRKTGLHTQVGIGLATTGRDKETEGATTAINVT